LAATIHEPFAGTFVQNEPFQLAFTKFVAVIWSFAPVVLSRKRGICLYWAESRSFVALLLRMTYFSNFLLV